MTAVEKNETTHENTTDNSGFKRVYSITIMKALSDKRGACAAPGGGFFKVCVEIEFIP